MGDVLCTYTCYVREMALISVVLVVRVVAVAVVVIVVVLVALVRVTVLALELVPALGQVLVVVMVSK